MELTIRPMTPQERMYSYSQSTQIEGQAGCIGHLRGDLDGDREAFLSSWTGHRDDLKTQDFKDEFDDVINALRFDDQYGSILKSRRCLAKFCFSHPESNYGNDREFGFRADTPSYLVFGLHIPHRKREQFAMSAGWLPTRPRQAMGSKILLSSHSPSVQRVSVREASQAMRAADSDPAGG